MAESLDHLKSRWLEQDRKVSAIGKTIDYMNASELWESWEHVHRRIEYLERLKDDIESELGFAFTGICRIEMILADHSEIASRLGQCTCEWCRTGSDHNTGLKT